MNFSSKASAKVLVLNHPPAAPAAVGYDPIFTPNGASKTFGEMTLDEKSRYSHRRRAADQLVLFLQQQSQSQALTTGKKII